MVIHPLTMIPISLTSFSTIVAQTTVFDKTILLLTLFIHSTKICKKKLMSIYMNDRAITDHQLHNSLMVDKFQI